TAVRRQTPTVPGNTLVTSINAQLQQDTQDALQRAIGRAQAEGNPGATTGAAVVMTTRGRVVAMASYPTYNPAVWTGEGRASFQWHPSSGSRPVPGRGRRLQHRVFQQ